MQEDCKFRPRLAYHLEKPCLNTTKIKQGEAVAQDKFQVQYLEMGKKKAEGG